MAPLPPSTRCGIDTVEIVRIEKLLRDHDEPSLADFFSKQEIADAGSGRKRAESLAARFAAKEACCKLFPKETCLGHIVPTDFSIRRDGYGAPVVECSPKALAVKNLHGISAIHITLTHTDSSASAVAMAETHPTPAPLIGKVIYSLLPFRKKVVMENLRRVFGETRTTDEIKNLAQTYYAHYFKCFTEVVKLWFMSSKAKADMIRIQNPENLTDARAEGKGVLLLTGHFGNWEVATVAGIAQFQEYHGLFHFIRRPLKPKFFNDFVMRRFTKAGFGTLDKSGSLDEILELLEKNHIVVSIFDQHSSPKCGVRTEFFGHEAISFKSLAMLSMSTGAPVLPASSWREPDGTHVLHFDKPIPLVECEKTSGTISRNTRNYNRAIEEIILRHPEQWIWMHKRWKNK